MLKAPFPWFGGKSRVAGVCWERFGCVPNYVEPFFGSGAVLLGRPQPFSGTETVNDADGYVCNFWRALQSDPESVAHFADWPVNENDLHARHAWLVERKEPLRAKLEGDPDFYDAKIAGWWVWGICCWIGGEFCSGKGPWHIAEVDGVRHLVRDEGAHASGVNRRRVDMTHGGRGVVSQLPALGDGMGVHRGRIELRHNGRGVNQGMGGNGLLEWLYALADRLRRVRVCCGDWSRVCGPTPTVKQGLTAVFLDPPYGAAAGRDPALYATESATVAVDCLQWCLDHGADALLRIALCGYEGEGHEILEVAGWSVYAWKAPGGYASIGDNAGKDNAKRERIWFSPNCLKPAPAEPSLFDSLPIGSP